MESCCKPPKNLSFVGDVSENWRKFKQNFDIFLTASGSEMKESKVKVALLLNFMGEEGVERYNSFNLEDDEKNDIEKVLQAFQEHCAPEKNVVLESFKFLNRSQADAETFESFVTSLEKLSEACEYGNMRDRMIRDGIVSGIRDKALRARLLRIRDLDLQKALEMCRVGEASEAAAKASDVKVEDKIGSTEEEANKTESEATFRYTVKNFSKMKKSQLSPPCYVHNLPWKIDVRPDNNKKNPKKYLSFYLECNSESKSTTWRCDADAELRLLSNEEGTEPLSKRIHHLFQWKSSALGFREFISWQDVLDVENGYIKDDSITLEVHVVSGEPYEEK